MKLPGVGPRQGARFVLSLLERPDGELREFGDAVARVKEEIRFCDDCFNLADEQLCSICTDSKRDGAKMMVVEKVTDLTSIERTGLYRGLYHVLGGAISPVDGVTPENLRIRELQSRLAVLAKPGKDIEVVLATNPSTAGETTALYLRDALAGQKGLTITRLARGLASGSNLEYADETTLKNALDHRK